MRLLVTAMARAFRLTGAFRWAAPRFAASSRSRQANGHIHEQNR